MRIIGVVAVEPIDAEIDAPAEAVDVGVFGDRVEQRMARAIVDHRSAGAKAARDRLRRPRQPRGLADVLDADDAQLRVPEAIFLGVEVGDDAVEGAGKVAGRHVALAALVARPRHPEIHLQPTRRARLRDARDAKRKAKRDSRNPAETDHLPYLPAIAPL